MKTNNSAITVKAFVEKLAAGGGIHPSPAGCVEYGVKRGWLEQQDAVIKEAALLRKQAARIIHNFLCLELKEADEIDGSQAYTLQDLFDCHVCTGHIIQVYVKGIMDGVALPDGTVIFAAEEIVFAKEAEELVNRVLHRNARTPRGEESFQSRKVREPEELSLEQAMQLLAVNEKVLLVDVRTEREYAEGCLRNAVNIPLLSIIKNPFGLSESRDKMILLYCYEGYQSKAAAQCLLEAGYPKAAYFAGNKYN